MKSEGHTLPPDAFSVGGVPLFRMKLTLRSLPDACSPYPGRSQAPALSRCRYAPERGAAEHVGDHRW